MNDEISIEFAGATDIGLNRNVNEDHFLIADLSKAMTVHQSSLGVDSNSFMYGGYGGQLYVVADGIGGDAAGERASELAITTMSQYVLNVLPWFFRLGQECEEEFHSELKKAVINCEEVITAEAEAIPTSRGMGTTLTVAFVNWPTLYVVHVGDSRCYLHRGKDFRQITRDHTLAQSLIDDGAMSAADAQNSPWVHVLHNAVGKGRDKLHPEVYRTDLEPGDTLLLCTDGLTGELADESIAQLLDETQDSQAACQRLVEEAKTAGGSDNITVIVARHRVA